MIRRKIKGGHAVFRRPLPMEEPDFYQSPHVMRSHEEALRSSVMSLSSNHTEDSPWDSLKMEPSVESPFPLFSTCGDNYEDDHIHGETNTMTRQVSEDVAFFEGTPFHFVEGQAAESSFPIGSNMFPLHAQEAMTIPQSILDPTEELRKIRAQIQQKQAEYEQTVGKPVRLSRTSSTLSQRKTSIGSVESATSVHPDTTTALQKSENCNGRRRVSLEMPRPGNIPVYKGSYIAV